MHYRFSFIITFATFCFVTAAMATENEYTIQTDPVTKKRYFIFTSPKGNVRFNHDKHQAEMKEEYCLPCHKTKTPTKQHTMSRFDQRYAHAFCKGCHRDKGRGPVECHECHKENRK